MTNEAIFLHASVIRGHHVYKAVWTPLLGECLQVDKEPGNLMDRHAVAVLKGEDKSVVGHTLDIWQRYSGTLSATVE